jgi:hypothetical protein
MQDTISTILINIIEHILINSKSHLERFALLNHIYGCIVIFEALSSSTADLTVEYILISRDSKSRFDIFENFERIGFEYGFSMDKRLELSDENVFNTGNIDIKSYNDDVDDVITYKEAWISLFEEIVRMGRNVETINTIEDEIFTIIDKYCQDEIFIFNESSDMGEVSVASHDKMCAMFDMPLKETTPITTPTTTNTITDIPVESEDLVEKILKDISISTETSNQVITPEISPVEQSQPVPQSEPELSQTQQPQSQEPSVDEKSAENTNQVEIQPAQETSQPQKTRPTHRTFRVTRRLRGRRSITPMKHHRKIYNKTIRNRVRFDKNAKTN